MRRVRRRKRPPLRHGWRSRASRRGRQDLILDSVIFAEVAQFFQGAAEDTDHSRDLSAVELHLRIAVGQAVNRFVLLQAILLVGEALDQLVQLRAQDERDIPHAEKPAALRAVNLFAPLLRHVVNDELPLTARALEDLWDHARPESTPEKRKRSRKSLLTFKDGAMASTLLPRPVRTRPLLMAP